MKNKKNLLFLFYALISVYSCSFMTIKPDQETLINKVKNRTCYGGKIVVESKNFQFNNLANSIKSGFQEAIDSCENTSPEVINISLEKTDDENSSPNYASFIISLFIVPLHSTESYDLIVKKGVFSARSSIVLSEYISPYYIFYFPNYYFKSQDQAIVYKEVLGLLLNIEEQEMEFRKFHKIQTHTNENLFRNMYRYCLSSLEECGNNDYLLKKISDSKHDDKVKEADKLDLNRLVKVVSEKNDIFMHGCYCRKNPDPKIFAKCPVESDLDYTCQIRYECLKVNNPSNCDDSFLKNLISLEKKFQKGKIGDEYIKSKVGEQLRLFRLKQALK
ncbi:MAG: hypothetical protein MUF77_07835 [Leptospira sp.]|nr:hypothetical protein [Leptospira sp.]